MKPIQKKKDHPEKRIQLAIKAELEKLGWLVKETHGSEFQRGFPDLYATHKTYGPRWIEVKNPDYWVWTIAQKQEYPLLFDNGTKIWVLMSVDDIPLLYKPANLKKYMKW